MEKRPDDFLGAIGPVGVITALAGLTIAFIKHHDSFSMAAGSILDLIQSGAQGLLHVALIIGGIYLGYKTVLLVIKFYLRQDDLETVQQKQIEGLNYRVLRLDQSVETFNGQATKLHQEFRAIRNEFEAFKKEFHGDWQISAGGILKEAAKDPKVIASLKEQLFPKVKIVESKSEKGVNDDHESGSLADRCL